MRTLVTGVAGFIGMHVAQALLERGDEVVGIDNLNDYYDVGLKRARLARLQTQRRFQFELIDLADQAATDASFDSGGFERVVHLAAQAGVRYSLKNPHAYAQSNLVGFLNVLEGCRQHGIGHLVYASSSSVYGGNRKVPFAESDMVDNPVSLYAATKKANELMAHSYSHLYGLPTTGLRFFTVYGPWGRPDMAYYLFTRAILAGDPISVFNKGNMKRDFTYIDDIVDGVLAVLGQTPTCDTQGTAAYRILNIGGADPIPLLKFIAALERALGCRAQLKLLPMQPGDVHITHADVSRLRELTGLQGRTTSIDEGLRRFVDWYHSFHGGIK